MAYVKEIKIEELHALCSYYTQHLGRVVGVNEILEFVPNNKAASDLAWA